MYMQMMYEGDDMRILHGDRYMYDYCNNTLRNTLKLTFSPRPSHFVLLLL